MDFEKTRSCEFAKPIVTRLTVLPKSLQILAKTELSTPPEKAITTSSEFLTKPSTAEYNRRINSSCGDNICYFLATRYICNNYNRENLIVYRLG